MTIEIQDDVVALKRIGRVVTETSDGWTLAGANGNLSAQYEHTMIITKGAPIVVTQH